MEDFEQQLQEVYFAVDRYVKFRIGMAESEDLVQDICLAAYRSYGQLKDRNAFKSWIFSIARNKCNDFFRISKVFFIVELLVSQKMPFLHHLHPTPRDKQTTQYRA